jgi:hypothetical protein
MSIYTFEKPIEMMFMGMNNGQKIPVYPCWLYKDGVDPVLVNNTDEDDQQRKQGYDSITAAAMSNRHLINWFWDLEDMSANQLSVFARDEFNVDLPVEAGQEKLFQAVIDLTRNAPQNRNRLILMAHTIAMNYNETLEEIKRMMIPGISGVCSEVTTFEVEI